MSNYDKVENVFAGVTEEEQDAVAYAEGVYSSAAVLLELLTSARRKRASTELVGLLKEIGEKCPTVKGIAFVSYVPSFNDGDPCVQTGWAEFYVVDYAEEHEEDDYCEGQVCDYTMKDLCDEDLTAEQQGLVQRALVLVEDQVEDPDSMLQQSIPSDVAGAVLIDGSVVTEDYSDY